MVSQQMRAWRDFFVFCLILLAVLAIGRHVRQIDFGLAIGIKVLFILGSIILLWRVFRQRNPLPHMDGQLGALPPRWRRWVLGEKDLQSFRETQDD